jgi:hypothetical protein
MLPLDSGLVLYVGLIVLSVWRCLSGWRICGAWLGYANYCLLLYILLAVLIIYAIHIFAATAATTATADLAWADLPAWLRPMIIGAPAAMCIVFMLNGIQTYQHVRQIFQGVGWKKHDRAVQIIALPAVYGTMAMSSLAQLYTFFNSKYDKSAVSIESLEERERLYEVRSDTCFWVGDLYEAWALYQFGKLTLELIKESVWKKRHSPIAEVRETAGALVIAHGAIEKIALLGVSVFGVVCLLQAGTHLYTWLFSIFSQAPKNGLDQKMQENTSISSAFTAAGMVASGCAIYSIHTVESTFHAYLEAYRPILKFITVKIIVSLAFFQKGIFKLLHFVTAKSPKTMNKVISTAPFLGDILTFSDVEFDMFYDSLILYECVIIALLHVWGWSAHEEWYEEDEGEALNRENSSLADKERMPLLSGLK